MGRAGHVGRDRVPELDAEVALRRHQRVDERIGRVNGVLYAAAKLGSAWNGLVDERRERVVAAGLEGERR